MKEMAAQGKTTELSRQKNRGRRSAFLEYRIYRRKYLGTAAEVVLVSLLVFSGTLYFLLNIWVDDLRQQSGRVFAEREGRLEEIQKWALNYTNDMYGDVRLLEDVVALFRSRDMKEYLWVRRGNSLGSNAQIGYFPANIKKLVMDSRSQVTGVTLRDEDSLKAVWFENGDARLSFDFQDQEDVRIIGGLGDMVAATCSVRDPEHRGQTLGKMDFWIRCSALYKGNIIAANWGILDGEGRLLVDAGLAAGIRMEHVPDALEESQSGWLDIGDGLPVFFVCHVSGKNGYVFLVEKDAWAVLADNFHIVLALMAAFVLVDIGVLTSSYMGIRADAVFLSTIMEMLSAMEGGDFDRISRSRLPVRHRKNEYGMIAVALKDVGMKLQGYIETEYILKLKEQESQMRALQHQIDPHFLYNTLEMLRSKALVHNDRDMADAIAMLGTLYRARMHRTDSITLQEEFGFLEMYLKIMELRFGGHFVYQVELDPKIGEIPTINFWLQPLAENFFTHGYVRESEINLLIVNGHRDGRGVRIDVLDNGKGADPGRLEEIRRNMMEGNDDPKADIGLRNVYMRLQYFYGDGFSMEVGNSKEGGFHISVFLPGLQAAAGKDIP